MTDFPPMSTLAAGREGCLIPVSQCSCLSDRKAWHLLGVVPEVRAVVPDPRVHSSDLAKRAQAEPCPEPVSGTVSLRKSCVVYQRLTRGCPLEEDRGTGPACCLLVFTALWWQHDVLSPHRPCWVQVTARCSGTRRLSPSSSSLSPRSSSLLPHTQNCSPQCTCTLFVSS